MSEQLTTESQQQSEAPADTGAEQLETAPEAQEAPQAEQQPNVDPEDSGQEPNPEVSKLRKESAGYRTKLRETEKAVEAMQAQYDQLLRGLGQLAGKEPDDDVDPQEAIAQAQAERDNARKELNELRVTNDLTAKAQKAGLNTRLLLPLLKGEGKLDGLAPGSDDYDSQVDALIDAVKDGYPELAAQVAPRSSGNAAKPTNNTDGKKLTADDLTRLSQEGKWDEINKAAAEGRIA